MDANKQTLFNKPSMSFNPRARDGREIVGAIIKNNDKFQSTRP